MNKEEKIKLARKLMMEVELEEVSERKAESENHICECGHKRSNHGISYNINYTGGFCKECDCKHFLMNQSSPSPANK